MNKIDLTARFKSAFGYQPPHKENKTDKREDREADPLFEEITIKKNEQEKLFFGSMMNFADNKVYAPPPMCSFSRSKNLTITEIDGADAEIVERYGDKSWHIKLQGIIVDMQNHAYPKKQAIKLREFFDIKAPFIVEGQIFDDLNIKNIYLTEVEISGVAGYADSLQYTLTARSIKPVEFFFVKKNT